MRLTVQILLVVSFLNIALKTQAAPAAKTVAEVTPISKERMWQCFKDYKFIYAALTQISDIDFADKAKSKERKSAIRKAYEKSPSEIRSCLDDIIQNAKNQEKPEDLKGIIDRLKEISSIVYSPKTDNTNSSAILR